MADRILSSGRYFHYLYLYWTPLHEHRRWTPTGTQSFLRPHGTTRDINQWDMQRNVPSQSSLFLSFASQHQWKSIADMSVKVPVVPHPQMSWPELHHGIPFLLLSFFHRGPSLTIADLPTRNTWYGKNFQNFFFFSTAMSHKILVHWEELNSSTRVYFTIRWILQLSLLLLYFFFLNILFYQIYNFIIFINLIKVRWIK